MDHCQWTSPPHASAPAAPCLFNQAVPFCYVLAAANPMAESTGQLSEGLLSRVPSIAGSKKVKSSLGDKDAADVGDAADGGVLAAPSLERLLLFSINGELEYYPDGRKCCLCEHKDNEFDPVHCVPALLVQLVSLEANSSNGGLTWFLNSAPHLFSEFHWRHELVCLAMSPSQKRYMWWGYKPSKAKKSSGAYCGYCCKIFQSEARARLRTIDKYKLELGSDKKLLDVHAAKAGVVVSSIIEQGCQRTARLDWNLVNKITVEIVTEQSMEVEHPGWGHHELNYYMRMNNYELKEGDTKGVFKGVEGVWVADAPIRKVKFSEKISSRMERQLMGGMDAASAQQVATDGMNSMVSQALGVQGRLFAQPAGSDFFDGSGIELAEDDKPKALVAKSSPESKRAASTLAQGIPPESAPSAAFTARDVPRHLSFPHAPSLHSGGSTIATEAEAKSEHGPFGLEQSAAFGRKTRNLVKREPGVTPQKAPKVPVGDGTSKKKGPGRPPLNLFSETEKIHSSFMEATLESPTWFGAEVKCQLKKIDTVVSAVDSRIAKSMDLEQELPQLQVCKKKLMFTRSLVESCHTFGLASDAFCKCYDSQATWCSLEPKVLFEIPDFLHWSAARCYYLREGLTQVFCGCLEGSSHWTWGRRFRCLYKGALSLQMQL